MDRRATPYLIALTPEAESALAGAPLRLDPLPLRFGRDLRSRNRFRLGADRRQGASGGPNDVYLQEVGPRFRLSREHFLIAREGDRYYVEDRESACGTLVEGKPLGGARCGGRRWLSHGDTILAGGHHTPWAFRFHSDGVPPGA